MGLSHEELQRFTRWAAERIDAGREETLENLASRWREAATPSPEGGSLLDRLRADGLVGAVNSGIGDLSTNPAHMEGFGER